MLGVRGFCCLEVTKRFPALLLTTIITCRYLSSENNLKFSSLFKVLIVAFILIENCINMVQSRYYLRRNI